MRIIRGLAKAVCCVALGVVPLVFGGVSAQAQGPNAKAPGVLEGIYDVTLAGQGTKEWEIFPLCVPVVGDLREPLTLPLGCRLKITPQGEQGAEAVLVGGRWTFEYNEFTKSDAVKCPDGTTAGQREIYQVDAATLTGELQIIRGAVCGWEPTMFSIPLTMVYKRPLPIPINQYPLVCEPGGLRLCR